MGIFSFLSGPDINKGVQEYRNSQHAILLDVRTREEYRQGHIDKAVLLPLDEIEACGRVLKDKEQPVFVYCYSGGRASKACAYLKNAGYQNVKNIGGISRYQGEIKR